MLAKYLSNINGKVLSYIHHLKIFYKWKNLQMMRSKTLCNEFHECIEKTI